jgi:type IX secretion system PorP/SprF family membrane protein
MIRNMIRSIFWVLLLPIGFCTLNAQDVNFSQFNVIASYYNPAFNSTFNGNFKVSAIQRSQWIGFQDQPISSFCISADIKFDLGLQDYRGDYFGAGVYFITDRTQIFDWNSNEIGLLISYHKLLDKTNKNYLSVGVGFGITQRSINYDNIYFEDQFDGISNYNGQSNELLPPNIFSRPEMKFGIQHNVALSSNWRLQSGLAIHYLFRPDLSFYKDFDDKDYIGTNSIKAPNKFTGIVNLMYHSSSTLDIYPKLLLTLQGPHQLLNTGVSVRKSFYNLNQTAFHAGLTTRIISNLNSYTPADLGFHVGFEIKDFIIGLHYDLGIKDAVKYGSPTNSFEISFSLLGNYDRSDNICPTF